ncbi:hypothetical protein KY343_01835 [Candidatus Woesearchaeota archaeon]|nr:hypothetical protein [Candidatus Woesearchaeota archaeon]
MTIYQKIKDAYQTIPLKIKAGAAAVVLLGAFAGGVKVGYNIRSHEQYKRGYIDGATDALETEVKELRQEVEELNLEKFLKEPVKDEKPAPRMRIYRSPQCSV